MPTTITNEASTTYQFNGSSEVNNLTSNENTIVLEDTQGLLLTKNSNPSDFLAGEIITYSITITNTSANFLTGVRIIDNLGGGNLAYVLGSASLTTATQTYPVTPIATNPLTFTLQQLGVGASMTLTYRAQVIFNLPSTVTAITNTVQGIGYTSTGTITGFANRTIQKKNSGLDITFNKSASETNVFSGQVYSYRLTYVNGTSTGAVALSITDQLPANFEVTSITIRVGGGSEVTLSGDDYTISNTNFLTIPSSTVNTITIPANGTTIVTINGYLI